MRQEVQEIARGLRQRMEGLRRAGVRQVRKARSSAAAPASPTAPDIAPLLAAVQPARVTAEASPDPQAAEKLAELARAVAGCTRCAELVQCRTQTVFGVGNPQATLCFIGEAPGADEDAQGEPFVGAAGQLLTRIIAAMGLSRSEVYICNVLKCRPPGNRTPLPDEVSNCRAYLEQQLAIIQPRFICALGAVAARTLLDTAQSIGRLRGRFHDFRGIPVLCTYHPAYLLRTPEAKKDVWEDVQVLMREMGLAKNEDRG